MSNMSYCRFQNTSRDLSDCQDALAELIDYGTGKLSREELVAAHRLVRGCIDIVRLLADARHIDIDSEDGMDQLENSFESILDDVNSQAAEEK